MGNARYALRRKLDGHNKCILWRLDEDNKYVEPLEGYIDYRNNVVKVYKDHRKVDTISLLLTIPLYKVKGLSSSQIAALKHDGMLPTLHRNR